MYKISDFAKETNISVKTLRYYDEIDFFKPSYVDFFSGYRYYSDDQIDELKKINDLKEIGLSLNEIKMFLNNNDSQILLKKREEMSDIMEKLDNIINNNAKVNYSILEGDYKKYVELNGQKLATCPQALEVRDNNAYYYVINKNGKFFADFCIYKDNNWITLDKKYILDKDIMNIVIKEIANYIDNICFFIPNEDEKYISDFKLIYKEFDLMEVTQGNYIYKKISIKI